MYAHERDRHITIELAPGPSAPRAARATVRRMLPDADPRVVERAMLVVSELVTNAVMHADTEIVLDVSVDGNHVRVLVEDGDPRIPEALDDSGPHGGFGLHIVERLADSWGIAPRDNGKAVWVDLLLDVNADGANGRSRDDGDLQDALG
jgi:anti-sigma regulatory factor (Ser/Thr protein kinase)